MMGGKLLAALVVVWWAVPTLQAVQVATTTAAPGDAKGLVATITGLTGLVQVREAEDKAWKDAAVGMKLDEGAEFRTGPRSAVRFTIPPDQTITLDRLGTIKVLQAVQQAQSGKVSTDLGMKYGRARYDIQQAGLEHDSKIRSPGSTLAIRGTDVTYEDQAPWVPSATSIEGRAEFRDFRRQMIAFGGQGPAGKNNRADVRADKSSVAAAAEAKTKSDPRGAFAGRTESEDLLLASLPSQGGVDARGLQAIRELEQAGFSGTFVGTPNVDGPLSFELQWFPAPGSQTQGPSNLDLVVTDPRGQVASKTNLVIGSGTAIGEHSGDDVGAAGFGIERVQWGSFFPAGKYNVRIDNVSGDAAQTFLLVTRKETLDIKQLGTDPANPLILQPGGTVSTTVNINKNSGTGATSAATAKRRR